MSIYICWWVCITVLYEYISVGGSVLQYCMSIYLLVGLYYSAV